MITNREEILNFLNEVFIWKYNSLAAYIRDAEPFVKSGREELLKAIAAIADEDQRQADQAAKLIEKMEGIPMVQPYDWQVSELNYLNIDFLADVLIAELNKQLDKYRSAGKPPEDFPDVKKLLFELQDSTGKQIRKLEELRGAP